MVAAMPSRVLLVTDDPALPRAVALVLRSAGYEMATPLSGANALAHWADEKPDLLLVDFMMPLMNGAEMIREVRKDGARKQLPIVLMSGAHEHILKHYYDGYDAYLKKPFTKEELVSLLQKLLPTPKP